MWIGLLSVAARADRIDDLVRIHLEALGGKERVAALSAMRATGSVVAGGKRVRFTMIAARPDRVRLETDGGGRTLVQAYDGKEPPWEFDTGTWPPHYRAIADNVAKSFVADAEFDDPLIAGPGRGYTFDYGGEATVDERPVLRVLVTRNMREAFSLLIDSETYLITLRVEQRSSPSGRPIQVITRYEDYRPVDGVLLPHKITVVADGKATQQTVIQDIVPNPEISPDTFTRPQTGDVGTKTESDRR